MDNSLLVVRELTIDTLLGRRNEMRRKIEQMIIRILAKKQVRKSKIHKLLGGCGGT